MNLKSAKKVLIIMGLILLCLYFLRYPFLMLQFNTKSIVLKTVTMALSTILEIVTKTLGIAFLVSGIIIREDNKTEYNKNTVRKYKTLRFLGYLPFIGILFFAIYEAIFGFSFLFSTSYGLEAFFYTILVYSHFIWPIYILGLIIIIINSIKIKSFKESQIENVKE